MAENLIDQITLEEVSRLRSMRLKWWQIAHFFYCDVSTLYRWRKRSNYVDVSTLELLSDDELDEFVSMGMYPNENRGEEFVWTYLHSNGVNVTRQRVRDSIVRVDALYINRRYCDRLQRVQYKVKGPFVAC